MAVRGLSENWLFKFCGDLHWQEITRHSGVQSHEIVSDTGDRIYASFVAIRSRYAKPVGMIGENEIVDFGVTVDQFGAAVVRSRQEGVSRGSNVISIEMITKFVSRARDGSNELRRASFRPHAQSPLTELDVPPPLMRDFQAVRDGAGYAIDVPGADAVRMELSSSSQQYTPNPYVDYNGAGLLYFAAYPAIADHLERRIVGKNIDVLGGGDWALGTSTAARDIFYFGNLDLGKDMEAQVHSLEVLDRKELGRSVRLHTTLVEADTKRRLAEIFTVKDIIA